MLHHGRRAALANSAAPPDAKFNYVTMLLHGDGTNGAQNNTFLDSSSNAFTITRNGNTTQGSFSPYGSNWSNYFGGSGNHLNVTGGTACTFGTGDFTIEFWCYANGTQSAFLYDSRPLATDGAYPMVYISADVARYYVSGADRITGTFSPNTWHHIAVSRSGTTTKMFIDGVQAGTYSDSTNYLNGTGCPYIATQNGGGTYTLNGYISNLRVVKGTAVYTSAFTPSTTPLTAISGTSLLTCQSNRFVDSSASPLAITVTGTPSVQRFNPFGTSTAYSAATIGGSGYFDATGDYLSLANNSNLNLGAGDFTLECWFYRVSSIGATANILWSQWNNDGDNVSQLIANGTSCLFRIGANQWTFGSFNKDSWNHVAVSRASGTVRMFVNGTLQSTQSDSTDITTTSKTVIGCNDLTSGGANFFGGYISGFRQVKGTAVYTAAFTPPTSPPTAITNTKLLLNFTNGAIYDNAMMNDLETVGNAQISTSVKKYGTGSLAFDGTGDYLSVPNIPPETLGGGDFTVEMWINLTSKTTQQTIITKGGQNPSAADQNGWTIFIYSSTLYFFIRDGSGSGNLNSQFCSSATWAAAITNGAWAHLAIVRSGTTITAYANGTSLGSLTSASNPITTDPVIIGAAFNTTANYMTGYIDDLRITKGYARYTTTFTPPTAAFPNTGPN